MYMGKQVFVNKLSKESKYIVRCVGRFVMSPQYYYYYHNHHHHQQQQTTATINNNTNCCTHSMSSEASTPANRPESGPMTLILLPVSSG